MLEQSKGTTIVSLRNIYVVHLNWQSSLQQVLPYLNPRKKQKLLAPCASELYYYLLLYQRVAAIALIDIASSVEQHSSREQAHKIQQYSQSRSTGYSNHEVLSSTSSVSSCMQQEAGCIVWILSARVLPRATVPLKVDGSKLFTQEGPKLFYFWESFPFSQFQLLSHFWKAEILVENALLEYSVPFFQKAPKKLFYFSHQEKRLYFLDSGKYRCSFLTFQFSSCVL